MFFQIGFPVENRREVGGEENEKIESGKGAASVDEKKENDAHREHGQINKAESPDGLLLYKVRDCSGKQEQLG